jgi:hypothetical protein
MVSAVADFSRAVSHGGPTVILEWQVEVPKEFLREGRHSDVTRQYFRASSSD